MTNLTELCPVCWGAKGRCCDNTGLRIISKHGEAPQSLMIEDLKRRRVEFWKIARSLPDTDENRPRIEQAARAIYDKLVELGVKL